MEARMAERALSLQSRLAMMSLAVPMETRNAYLARGKPKD
jgi:hypothetical protein